MYVYTLYIFYIYIYLPFAFSFYAILFACVFVCMNVFLCTMVHMWTDYRGQFSSFQRVGPGDQTEISDLVAIALTHWTIMLTPFSINSWVAVT